MRSKEILKKSFCLAAIMVIPVVLSGCINMQWQPFQQGTSKTDNNTKSERPKRQLPPRPKIKEHYNSVLEYWQDMKKVQLSNDSYSLKGNLLVEFVGNSKFVAHQQDKDYLVELLDFQLSPKMSSFFNFFNTDSTSNKMNDILKETIKSIPKKTLYIGGETYHYGFEGNSNIAVKAPLTIKSRDSKTSKSFSSGATADSSSLPIIFDWYSNLYNPKSKPVFTMENAIYNGFKCRLINFETINDVQKHGSKTLTNKYVTEACISDEYGIAVYANSTMYTEKIDGSFDNMSIIDVNVSKIKTNSVDESILSLDNLTKRIIDKNDNISLEEFNKLIKVKK